VNASIPLPILYAYRCTGCALCVEHCPADALATRAGKAVLAAPDLCTYCTLCEDVCPTDAIALPFLVTFKEHQEAR
jgi:NAD-dependent dihydropyrimidine dehydrogenase PreA subunit